MLPLTHLHDQEPLVLKAPPSSLSDTTPQPDAPPTSFHLTNGDAVWVFYHSGFHSTTLSIWKEVLYFFILLYVCHRQSQSSATKKSPSGDIPQEVTQEANRRPVQRGQSEDVPNTYRSQVIWPLLVIHESVLFKLHVSDIYRSVKQCLFCLALRASQELVEMTDMENDSDGGGYPVLEGHGRAASMPRLNAGFQVNISYPSWPYEVILVGVEKNCCTAFVSYSD